MMTLLVILLVCQVVALGSLGLSQYHLGKFVQASRELDKIQRALFDNQTRFNYDIDARLRRLEKDLNE